MATNLEFNRGNSSHALRGLNNKELQSAATLSGGKSTAIENRVASLSSKEASVFLSNLKGKIHDRPGYLKLMHTEHNRTMAFETKSGLGALLTKNERRSETESALKGLFRALKLKPDQLQELNTKIANIGGDHLQARDAASIIEEALSLSRANELNPFPEPKTPPSAFVQGGAPQAMRPNGQNETRLGSNLASFRQISVGDVVVGGSARPGGNYLRNGATVSNVLKDIQDAGFTHILSLDQSERPAYTELKEGLKNTPLTHLQPPDLNIKDEVDDGEKKDLYEGSKPLSVAAFQSFKSEVEKISQGGGKVLVHCGAGAGRTGTMLASLILANLVEQSTPEYRTKFRENSHSKNYPLKIGNETIATTPLVRLAVETMRSSDKAFTGHESSLESKRELRLLEEYEKTLFAGS